jgi:hypothetical protein
MRGVVRIAETRKSQKGRTYYAFTLEGSEQEYTSFETINQGDEIEFTDQLNGDFHNAKKIIKINKSKATQAGLEPQKGMDQVQRSRDIFRSVALQQAILSVEHINSQAEVMPLVEMVLSLANAYFDWLTEKDLNVQWNSNEIIGKWNKEICETFGRGIWSAYQVYGVSLHKKTSDNQAPQPVTCYYAFTGGLHNYPNCLEPKPIVYPFGQLEQP